ncbi:ATP-dependent DNA ligase [Streptomyces sp. NPDC003857]
MEFPIAVALAQLVSQLPTGPGWWYEIKLDGHRATLWRTAEGVRLQARSGRDVTASWMDSALARMDPQVVLDGEAVIVVDGVISFEAAQSRAASAPARARKLAERSPALLIVWDVLALPGKDMRGRPYEERRAAMLDVVGGLPQPSRIQAVSASDDPDVAGRSLSWQKVRHAETVDADVVGYKGPALRPKALAVRLPSGRTALTQTLAAPLAALVGPHLAASGPAGRAHTDAGDADAIAPPGLVVEVLAGTTRHAVVTVTRLR